MPFCQACGHDNTEGTKFCGNCGVQLTPLPAQEVSVSTEAPPEKKKGGCGKQVLALLILVLVACALVMFSNLADRTSGPSTTTEPRATSRPAATAKPTSYKVRYEVTGTIRQVSLTISNADGGTEQIDRSLPWKLEFTGKPGLFLYLAAQKSTKGGTITSAIYVNGVQQKSATSDADYGIASVSMSLPR